MGKNNITLSKEFFFVKVYRWSNTKNKTLWIWIDREWRYLTQQKLHKNTLCEKKTVKKFQKTSRKFSKILGLKYVLRIKQKKWGDIFT